MSEHRVEVNGAMNKKADIGGFYMNNTGCNVPPPATGASAEDEEIE
jgi:hypothetical protein